MPLCQLLPHGQCVFFMLLKLHSAADEDPACLAALIVPQATLGQEEIQQHFDSCCLLSVNLLLYLVWQEEHIVQQSGLAGKLLTWPLLVPSLPPQQTTQAR